MENFIDWSGDDDIQRAFDYAKNAHLGQHRKITNADYIIHPLQVAELVYKLKKSDEISALVKAALLHDTLEDNENITPEDIRERFGELVCSLVQELTNNKDEIKKKGKEKYLIDKMLHMTSWGLVIKLCDRLANISDLADAETEKDKKFARYYIKQTIIIINDLKENRSLTRTQTKIIELIDNKLDYLNNMFNEN